MPAKIINEAVFQAVFDSVGLGNTWKVLKGRFLSAFRAWGAIIDIWKSDTQKQLEEVVQKAELDISEIKARYREAETQYAKENSIFNSAHGTNMMMFHPGLAMAEALLEPLMDETYRADTRRLLPYTGIQDWGLTPDFINNWIDSEAKKETQSARATVKGADGKTQTIDIFSYADKSDPTQNALNSLHGLFVESRHVLYEEDEASEPNKPFDKKDAEKLAQTIVAAYEAEGIFDEMKKTAQKIKEYKEEIINDVVVPSAETLYLLTDMLVSKDIKAFISGMDKLTKINKSLKALKPQDFESNIKKSVEEIKNDKELLDLAKQDLKKDEVSDQEIETMVFVNARNEFAKGTLETLEAVYEENINLLMQDITEKGLEAMKATDVGKEYAELIEKNIQLLENAIKSLNDLAKTKKGV